MPHEDQGAFLPEDFKDVQDIYGADVAWDVLYALGLGSEDWADIYPTVTAEVLSKAAANLAQERDTGSTRLSGAEQAVAAVGKASTALREQATGETPQQQAERVASRVQRAKPGSERPIGESSEQLFTPGALSRRRIITNNFGNVI